MGLLKKYIFIDRGSRGRNKDCTPSLRLEIDKGNNISLHEKYVDAGAEQGSDMIKKANK